MLEQIFGRLVPPLKPLAKNAKIEGVVADPRAKVKDAKGIPIADNVNPKIPPGRELNDSIRQAEAANYEVLASQLNVDIAQSPYRGSLAANCPTVNFVGASGFNAANGAPTNFNPSTTQNIFNNTITLQINAPIFSGGFNNSVIRHGRLSWIKPNPITTI